MCGLKRIGFIEPKIPTIQSNKIKINECDVYYIDSKDYQFDDVYFESQNISIAIIALLEVTNILFEKCYYKFNTKLSDYLFPKTFLGNCGDAITSFVLYRYVDNEYNENSKVINPNIILDDIIINGKISNVSTDDKYIKYIFDEYVIGDLWINVISKNHKQFNDHNYDNTFKISDLEPGIYMLEYIKVYCHKYLRTKLAQLNGGLVKLIKNHNYNCDVYVF